MATVKRKKRSERTNDLEERQAAATKRRRGAAVEQQEEATEEEVEEFFAILRRIRESAAGFTPGTGGVLRRRPGSGHDPEGRTVPAWRWRPSFEWEDFGEATAPGKRNKTKTPPPAAEDAEGEEDGGGDDDDETNLAKLPAKDGHRQCFDLNLEPSASEEQSAVALSRRYELKHY